MLMLPPRSGGNTCPKPNAGKSGATSRIHNRSKRAFAFTATHDLPLKTRKNRNFPSKRAKTQAESIKFMIKWFCEIFSPNNLH
jgi:hypothetical protein